MADFNRAKTIDIIHDYIEREYCEGGGAMEMIIARFTDEQLQTLHQDLISFFGEPETEYEINKDKS